MSISRSTENLELRSQEVIRFLEDKVQKGKITPYQLVSKIKDFSKAGIIPKSTESLCLKYFESKTIGIKPSLFKPKLQVKALTPKASHCGVVKELCDKFYGTTKKETKLIKDLSDAKIETLVELLIQSPKEKWIPTLQKAIEAKESKLNELSSDKAKISQKTLEEQEAIKRKQKIWNAVIDCLSLSATLVGAIAITLLGVSASVAAAPVSGPLVPALAGVSIVSAWGAFCTEATGLGLKYGLDEKIGLKIPDGAKKHLINALKVTNIALNLASLVTSLGVTVGPQFFSSLGHGLNLAVSQGGPVISVAFNMIKSFISAFMQGSANMMQLVGKSPLVVQFLNIFGSSINRFSQGLTALYYGGVVFNMLPLQKKPDTKTLESIEGQQNKVEAEKKQLDAWLDALMHTPEKLLESLLQSEVLMTEQVKNMQPVDLQQEFLIP